MIAFPLYQRGIGYIARLRSLIRCRKRHPQRRSPLSQQAVKAGAFYI